MSASRSRRNVLILDCCYSGAFPAGALAKSDSAVQTLERFQGRGRTVLTASDSTQYSFEGNQMHGSAPQSVFTRHLVAGLRDGSADLDDDGDITIDELYHYVYDRVTDEMPQQRPKKLDSVEGRLVIARNVNWSPPAAEPGAETGPRAAAGPAGPGEPPTLAAAVAALRAQVTAFSADRARRGWRWALGVPPASPLAVAAAGFLSATLAWPSAAIAVRGSLAWYVGTLAFVALAAGAGVLHPRTRAAAGPGRCDRRRCGLHLGTGPVRTAAGRALRHQGNLGHRRRACDAPGRCLRGRPHPVPGRRGEDRAAAAGEPGSPGCWRQSPASAPSSPRSP